MTFKKEDYKNKAKQFLRLLDLQIKIEELTMHFDENSVFKSSPSLIKLLIGKDMITAKEYLKQKKCGLSEKDFTYINIYVWSIYTGGYNDLCTRVSVPLFTGVTHR